MDEEIIVVDKIATKPKAFVLMPFAPEFDAIYEKLIVGALAQAGFEAFRADNIKSQSNIMRDIIGAIASSDLVLADLTSSNPNVYYELGIAHGLQRPVVLLTQEISELPFDLKSYRVIGYGTHFSEMDRAKRELTELAIEAGKGNVPFGSPVSDFLDRNLRTQRPVDQEVKGDVAEVKEDAPEEQLGFLDHLVDMEDSFGELTELMDGVVKTIQTIGKDSREATEKVTSAKKKQKPGTAKYQRKIIRELGNKTEGFGQSIAQSNTKYRLSHLKAQRSLEAVVAARTLDTAKGRAELRDFLGILNGTEGKAVGARETFMGLAGTLRKLDNIEATFTRAKNQAADEVERLADNIGLTIALIGRAREKGEGLLESFEDEDLNPNEISEPDHAD